MSPKPEVLGDGDLLGGLHGERGEGVDLARLNAGIIERCQNRPHR